MKDKLPNSITHTRTDWGSDFRSNTFRKWCGENFLRFFVGLPDYYISRLFHVLNARRSFVLIHTVFDEDVTSPLYSPDLHISGTITSGILSLLEFMIPLS